MGATGHPCEPHGPPRAPPGGGPKTIQQFIDENIWDEARVFEGNAEIENGIRAPKFSTRSSKALKIGKDRLWTVTNKLF